MRKIDCYAYQNSSYLCCIITQKNCFITWNKLKNQFRIYQICKKWKMSPLWQKQLRKKYYMNITFPDWVIVENIIPRNVIITFPELIFSTITQSENVIFILLYRILDPLFSTVLGLPWWGSSKGKMMHSLYSICMNEKTSFTKMVLLSSLNARTDHDVRSNKLRHKKSTTPNLIPSSVI